MLSHELQVELLETPQHLLDHLLLRQDGRPEVRGENSEHKFFALRAEHSPEVVGAWLLAEA